MDRNKRHKIIGRVKTYLDPSNYFVSFVPVHIDLPLVLLSDVASYLIIMALLFIPSVFITGIDPSKTVRVS